MSDDAPAVKVEALVLEHLAHVVGVSRSYLSRDSDIGALGLSSSQVMELVYEVENELGIVLTDSDLMRVSTVGELLDLAGRAAATMGAGRG
ncbi:MAG: acyl carrier protein [Acidimicrobiales bacterium]